MVKLLARGYGALGQTPLGKVPQQTYNQSFGVMGVTYACSSCPDLKLIRESASHL